MTVTLPAETSSRSARTARIPVAVLGATGSVGQRFVPLLLAEINADHLGAIERQRARRGGGYIVTNSNCSTMGLALAIAPIERRWGIDQLHVTTMQAVSGAGYNGVTSLAILDNVIPYISGEEEKLEIEPRKILGTC